MSLIINLNIPLFQSNLMFYNCSQSTMHSLSSGILTVYCKLLTFKILLNYLRLSNKQQLNSKKAMCRSLTLPFKSFFVLFWFGFFDSKTFLNINEFSVQMRMCKKQNDVKLQLHCELEGDERKQFDNMKREKSRRKPN